MVITIAIDGPSGSGKSTVAKKVAHAHGLAYLDTGAMYRALTWWAGKEGIDLDDEDAVARAAQDMPLVMGKDPLQQKIFMGEDDITEAIRTKELSAVVSKVATNLQVRRILVARQQALVAAETEDDSFSGGRGIVAEGRDITTVVCPDADLRLLITASEEARLARRSAELTGKADEASIEATRDIVTRRDEMDATVSQFLSAPEGVLTIDTSDLTIDQVTAKIDELIAALPKAWKENDSQDSAEQEADDSDAVGAENADESEATNEDDPEATARALRSALEAYELTDEDLAALEAEEDEDIREGENLPIVAVIGRPNVGKSTLINRIVGRRVAVVQDVPGVTRDRVRYPASWAGRNFLLVDTGGWEAKVRGIDASVALQAEVAIGEADVVMFVVDATVGATATDERVVELLRRAGKPVVLVANKVDSDHQEADAAYLWSLGLGEPYPVSALHGRGSGDMLDAVLKVLPEHGTGQAHEGPSRIALVGRPNVGKSSLLNQLAGEERAVVHDLAGTTRDPVDELIELDRPYVFVDTAGIRRRVHQTSGADYYASLRTRAAIERSDLGLVLLDASQQVTEQDVRVIQQVIDAGRALVIVANKWDLVDVDRQAEFNRELAHELTQTTWAERVNVSALTGWHTNRLPRAIDRALTNWHRRIPTGKLNAFLGELAAANPHPVRGGKQPRILFATQVSARPPRIVIFASGFIEAGYRRFIENRLRQAYDFTGTPIEISVRVRERRRR
ncbi:MAG: ribosome biogenesis GTPase Der [Flaviflexus sp.]|nr:ribosome biogenesis GTPase Der [Flaviflexus sp.]